MYFKGGTAINKILLNHIRLSEDLDFTITEPLDKIKKAIAEVIHNHKDIFTKLEYDKSVFDFTRYLVHYKSYFKKDSIIMLDLNKKAGLILPPEKCIIHNFYNISLEMNILNRKEMIAEKIAALINRNRPRDYFDVYQLIKHNIPIDLNLVKAKCKAQKQEFSIIKIFNNSNKIYSRWTADLSRLTAEVIPFHEVMKTLTEYFKYAEEKKKLKEHKEKLKKR